MATAVAGAVMGLHPFDQPDVEAAKRVTRRLAADYESSGALPAETPVFEERGVAIFTDARNAAALGAAAGERPTLAAWLRAHFARIRPGDYAALLAYLPMTASHAAALRRMRHRLRDAKCVATSVGFGPRYLHSTGQAYKGGPDTGVFLMLTADAAPDLPLPGHLYTFGVIEAAQARGDMQVLLDRGRRALRVHLGPDAAGGLAALDRALAEALA
jgi:transaldolase/glucose-6-phosphate isomerase